MCVFVCACCCITHKTVLSARGTVHHPRAPDPPLSVLRRRVASHGVASPPRNQPHPIRFNVHSEWRNYNYTGLAGALAKLGAGGKLFLMEYDMNLWEDYTCIVSGTCSPAEAPYRAIDAGIQTYLKQVPARSLVLGLPWYGQLYTRLLGVPVGQGQVDYSDVADLVKKHGWKPTWEKDDKAWRVVCGNHACFDDKKGTEIWFEDATSLQPKYALAKKYGLAGVGMFEATMLPYVSQPDLAKAMWDAATQWDQ